MLDSWTIDLENANRVGRGFLVGTVFAVCAELSLVVMVVLNRAATSPTWTFPQRLFVGLTVALLVAGYLCGLTAACYRPLRRLGAGILLGLTIMLPLAFLLGFAILWEGN